MMEADRDEDIPLATLTDLLTAPEGLYRVQRDDRPEPFTERRMVLDIRQHTSEMCDAILLARVRENRPVPAAGALDSFAVRPDGKQVVTQWVKRRG